MDPVALYLGPLTIRWYGVFFAIGFVAGYWVLLARARKSTVGETHAGNLALTAMLAGVAGARLLYVTTHWSQFQGQPWLEMLRIDHGGLVFYGGFIAATLSMLLYARRNRLPLGNIADLAVPALPLAHAFGRIGCFLNGCCFGKVSDSVLAWTYPATSDVRAIQIAKGLLPPDAVACLPVLPVQLFESGFNLLLCGGLLLLEKRLPRYGQLAAVYLSVYACGRFILEGLRGDYPAGGMLTPGQNTAILLLPAGLILFFVLGKFGARRKPMREANR